MRVSCKLVFHQSKGNALGPSSVYSRPVLNMIRFPDRDPTGFCTSEPDPDRTGFRKNSTGSDMDIQTALITAEKCLIRVFLGYKPDWIKYLDRSTGLGSDRISQRNFWTGLGFQKPPICSTLLYTNYRNVYILVFIRVFVFFSSL